MEFRHAVIFARLSVGFVERQALSVYVPILDNSRAAISFQGHHVVFGLELKEKLDKLGVEANLDDPGSKSAYCSIEEFFVAKLKW